jgi:hypothetical protein
VGSTAAVGGIKGVDIGVEEVLLHGLLPMAGDANIAGDQRGEPEANQSLRIHTQTQAAIITRASVNRPISSTLSIPCKDRFIPCSRKLA